MYSAGNSDGIRKVRRIFILFSRIDILQIIAMTVLLTFGIVFVYSTGQQSSGVHSVYWQKQIVWLAIGLSLWMMMTLTDYHNIMYITWFIYLFAVILCVLVLIPGIGIQIKGARRWIDFLGVKIQVSEIAKFAVLLALAKITSYRKFNPNKLKWLILSSLIVGIPFLLILSEPDLGTALVFIPMLGAVLFVKGLKWKFVIGALIAALIIIPTSYPFLRDYQKQRIVNFLNPEANIRHGGWQQYQAGLAVGSGGWFGKGLMNGTQGALGFLPETHTDFIFSVIAEETGFAGATVLFAAYFLLVFSALRTAVFARDEQSRILAMGIAVVFFVHSFINTGMSIGIMPVTGLPLPLVSYGGSFMVSSMLYLGILQSIYNHRRKRLRTTFFSDN